MKGRNKNTKKTWNDQKNYVCLGQQVMIKNTRENNIRQERLLVHATWVQHSKDLLYGRRILPATFSLLNLAC